MLWKSNPLVLSEPVLREDLENLIAELEASPALLEPFDLRERYDALDRLDALLGDVDRVSAGASSAERELCRQAQAMQAQLEAVNARLYAALRAEIREGSRPELLSQSLSEESDVGGGLSFDYLDELLTGLLELEGPDPPPAHPGPELVFYQPTPARHIFHLLRLAELTEEDVLVDLGSGLGHVPLLASICTGAHSIGVEREEAYVASARHCARQLNLDRVTFLAQDARAADLSAGTVFFLYTPFTGSVLADVLRRLRQESQSRPIRICTFGPCTETIVAEKWLQCDTLSDPDHIAIFRSGA